MRKVPLLLVGCAIIAAGCYFFLQTNQSPQATASLELGPSLQQQDDEDEQDDADKRNSFEFNLTKDPRLGYVPKERLIIANEMRNARLAQLAKTEAAVPGINWVERGPNNVGGRTRALLYDINGAPTYTKVWAGGVGGGLWYTNDITAATPVWNKVDDFFSNIAVTAIAQDSLNPNTMYFGTGEGWFNADAIQGLGIWKSTNGGTTWTQLASTNNNSNFTFIQKILCVPGTSIVLACTLNGGVQRSTDGGTNWTKVLGTGLGITGTTTNRAADIERASNGYLFASMGIFSQDGIYRSTDNGATWEKVYTALSTERRIELACAPSNIDSIYALTQSSVTSGPIVQNGINRIIFTANASAASAASVAWAVAGANPTWCDQGSTSNDFTRTQAWYDLIAAVNPTNGRSLTIGGVDMMRSTNGGSTWAQISQWASGCATLPNVHADIHAITYKPGSSTEFLVGNDGGVYRTTDNGTTFASKNNSYNVTQFYSGAIHPTSTNYFLAGSQDNGTQKFTLAGLGSTTTATGGDGGFSHIDQDNGNVQFTSFTGNALNFSTNGGTSFTFVNLGGGSFINPSDYDDVANNFYSGNAGGNFKRWVTPTVTNSPYKTVSVTAFGGSTVSHVMVSPLTPNRVYFGLNNGRVVRVDNAHQGTSTAGVLMFTHPSASPVTSIAIDPANEDHMLVTFGSYGVASVYETTNGTSGSPTFSSLDNNGVNLPDMPIRWAMFDPRNSDWALLATELGVWSTDNINGTTTDWQPTNTGLANVRTDMLQYRPADGTIMAATHGRGLYTATIPIGKTILFQQAGNTNTENSTSGTDGCRGYQEFTIPMVITGAPVGNATVTLSVAGSTAVQGQDFDFTTNNDFVSQSNQLTFPSGATANQTFRLRIYNDDIVETLENIRFTFTVTGSDAVKGTYNTTYNFLINDNDVAPFASATADYSVGSGTVLGYLFGVNSVTGSISNNRSRVQFLYLASELQAAGLKAGPISALKFSVGQKNSSGAYQGFTVSMANSALATLNGGFTGTGLTQVFTGDYTTAAGVNTVTFSTNFTWDGTSNVVVQFCHDNAAVINGDYIIATTTYGSNFYQVTRTQTAAGTGCTLAAQYGWTDRMDVTFTSTNNPSSVESALNATQTSSVYSGTSYNFYSSADNELVASVNNASADLGCVTARIDEAGTTWQTFTGGQRSQKVFEITPTTNSGASYQVVLYYTNAELSGFAPATLRMVKTNAASASAATSANSVIVTPTVTDYGTYKAFTANFTGFSRFFLINNAVTLPLVLKDFTGALNKEQHSDLKWTTASENNTREFVVERSLDGVSNFEEIGRVPARGNSTTENKYTLTDPYVAEKVNYYRLKMYDIDGRFEYSPLVIVRNPGNKLKDIRIVNNPFDSYLEFFFTTIPSGPMSVRLYDGSGKMYYQTASAVVTGNRWRLNTSGMQLASGNYFVEVATKEGRAVFKVVKK